jgi:ubiquinone/menaquinone biosynthesis C-methylase UbiE
MKEEGEMREEKVRRIVRKGYGKMIKSASCCGSETAKSVGYNESELNSVPKSATVSFGCGNPIALASLKEGETVVDLGAGGGLDCFLAANKVGDKGKIIGVDMTPEMIDKARDNLRKSKHKNVEFRLGEIENLPVADNTADIIISNCVINLSPNKKRVFEEAFRVLKKNGRLMISDIVLLKELPDFIKRNMYAYIECVSGAIMKNEYLKLIRDAGFDKVEIVEETSFPVDDYFSDEASKKAMKELRISAKRAKALASSVVSVKVRGFKPN